MPAATNLTATTTPLANRASAVISQIVPAKAQTQAPSTPYNDTRLGSSSPLYDTWEKNNNGAGSVTTSPK
jgi:hypothetical protein